MQEYLLVFDIETIPDTEVVANLIGNDDEVKNFLNDNLYIDNLEDFVKETPINQARKILEAYHLQITDGKNSFLRQLFHKVVVISYILVAVTQDGAKEHYTLKQVRSGGSVDSSEVDLIKGFFVAIDKYRPRLITFNGKTFDIPVLKYRAMKYGICAEAFYNSKDKWSNYQQRYAQEWNCDLIDVLSDFGASARIKLNEVCSLLGFPGKFGVDGGKVTTMIDNNQITEVRDYCETDVLNTYLVYLRYTQHTGKISKDSYNQAIQDILNFIDANLELKHLQEFKQAWQQSCRGEFFL